MDGLTVNNFNFVMLMLGLVLCGTPEKFSKACVASVSSVWGVIIQFPPVCRHFRHRDEHRPV